MATTTSATRKRQKHAPSAVAERPIMTTSEVRDNFADVFSRVSYGSERILVGRRGDVSKAVAMIPAADLKILEAIENRLDLRAALVALEANGNEDTVPWEQVKKKLGL